MWINTRRWLESQSVFIRINGEVQNRKGILRRSQMGSTVIISLDDLKFILGMN